MDLIKYTNYFTQDANSVDNLTGNLDLTVLLTNIIKTSNQQDAILKEKFEVDYFIGDDPQAWVITQNYLDFTRQIKAGENYSIQTQLEYVNRFFAYRTFFINASGEQVAKVSSQFAVIGLKDRKVHPINTKAFDGMGVVLAENKHNFSKIHPLENPLHTYEDIIPVQTSDIDGNDHVNNVSYLGWAIHQQPKALIKNYQPKSIDIKYGHEIIYGNDIQIRTQLSHTLSEIENRTPDEVTSYQEIINNTYCETSSTIKIIWTK